MARLTYVKAISEALEPLGFEYKVPKFRDKEWFRLRDGFEGCVLLQINSIADTTGNLSTRDMTTVAILEKAASLEKGRVKSVSAEASEAAPGI